MSSNNPSDKDNKKVQKPTSPLPYLPTNYLDKTSMPLITPTNQLTLRQPCTNLLGPVGEPVPPRQDRPDALSPLAINRGPRDAALMEPGRQ
jgi:hypothetical protein